MKTGGNYHLSAQLVAAEKVAGLPTVASLMPSPDHSKSQRRTVNSRMAPEPSGSRVCLHELCHKNVRTNLEMILSELMLPKPQWLATQHDFFHCEALFVPNVGTLL